MNAWDLYRQRIINQGTTKRGATIHREIHNIYKRLPENPSYTHVTIDEIDQDVAVINSDNLNEKTIISMPGEDIKHGGLVYWMDNHWLVTERDANTTIYTRAKMVQCNYLLKWIDDDHVIHQQWCIVEDGTKYLTGEYESRNFEATRGDSRIAVTIARNECTAKLNRENRFIIDDPDSEIKLAYLLTKPLKLGWSYNNEGVYKFVLQEVTATDNDNFELSIADYYKHFPRNPAQDPSVHIVIDPDRLDEDTGKEVWL